MVLITGGTEGLGLELVRIHQRAGERVIAIGSRAKKDAPQCFWREPQVRYIQCDLAHPDSDKRVVAALVREGVGEGVGVGVGARGGVGERSRERESASAAGGIDRDSDGDGDDIGRGALDYVYLNAAAGYWGEFSSQAESAAEALLAVTLLSPMLLLRGLGDYIKPGGTVKVISSVAHYLPRPEYALYAAAKAAVSECMRSIMFERSVHYHLSVIHPGAIATAFHRKSGMGERRIAFAQSAATVARAVVRKRGMAVVGGHNYLARLLGNARAMVSIMGGRPQKIREIRKTHASEETRAGEDTNARMGEGASARRDSKGRGTIIIIGAAEGIGLEIAMMYLRRSAGEDGNGTGNGNGAASGNGAAGNRNGDDAAVRKLLLIDNNGALLERNYRHFARRATGITRSTMTADIQSTSDLRRIEKAITAASLAPGGLSRIFITAAVSAVGAFHAIPRAAMRRVYNVNCLAAAKIVRYAMIARASAVASAVAATGSAVASATGSASVTAPPSLAAPCRIVLFSSLAAFVHYPGAAVYAATKSFVPALATALRKQKGRDGITLCAVYPGPIATRHAQRYSPDNDRASSRMSAAVAAERIARCVDKGKTMIFLRTLDAIMAGMALILPRVFGKIMRAALYSKITAPLLPPGKPADRSE